ncbi:zinc finger protein 653 isoform X2 [Gadus macrocephalus]|uniref:zinc finger protein 653 isoform X2 n=1 Tax=Gadus macrocephalus TaxID=80720 RepID=UPI0028CB983D|nr:zinc finger protein 653 isoform X2 [Gadus macrocephalus]
MSLPFFATQSQHNNCRVIVANMADLYAGLESPLDNTNNVLRRCRGRPRLTDTDRAQRRLESRKKYDVRRVYLGESHRRWTDLRSRTSLSDAGLAEYLMLLDSTYGEKYLQNRHGEKIAPEIPGKHKKGIMEEDSSLKSLVSWYQDHSNSCPYEPQLRGLEPQPGFATAAAWRCPAEHSFVQYLLPPPGDTSESEPEGEVEGNGEGTTSRSLALVNGPVTRQRRDWVKRAQEREEDAADQPDVCGDHGASARSPPAAPENFVGAEDQGSQRSAVVHVAGRGLQDREPEEDRRREDHSGEGEGEGEGAGGGGGREVKFSEELEITAGGYTCVVMATALTDKLVKAEAEPALSHQGAGPLAESGQGVELGAESEHAELFGSQGLQTMIDSCQIQGQRSSLEGPQLIIITGPGYGSLAPEGLQLSVAPGAVEEVTCTVIQGVAFDQVCPSDAELRAAEEDEESISGLSDKHILEPTEQHLESSCERERSRGLCRSRRSRRGPVIEADGMLKMFHCPYAGCSQVYVAISSYQNHVNLVHRKGRTKVCPHPGCGKKFYLSNHLHRHMIIHSGVRDFICETCGKSFKRKNHLEVHRRTHTGETPLQCEVCGYQCRQRASLNWHMKKHRTEEQYRFTCQHCGKRFEKLHSVKFHRLKSHPDQQASAP